MLYELKLNVIDLNFTVGMQKDNFDVVCHDIPMFTFSLTIVLYCCKVPAANAPGCTAA